MKRDMNLIIKLAILIESRSSDEAGLEIHIEDYDDSLIQYNLGLMLNGGLIKAINASTLDGELYLPLSLTWNGHDFLDATRNGEVLNKAKEFAKSKGLQLFELPFEVIKEIAIQSLKSLILG